MGYSNFKVVSWNVNGLNNPAKRSKVMTKLRKESSQIILLQETHLSQGEHKKLKRFGYNNTFYCTFKTGHKRGVAILLHNSINFELTKQIRDPEGRYILAEGKIESKLTTLLLCLPSSSKRSTSSEKSSEFNRFRIRRHTNLCR